MKAYRGPEVTLPDYAKGWYAKPVYLDMNTGLPYTHHEGLDSLTFLTPCCFAMATGSDPDWGLYCKKCYNTVSDLCGGGPDEEVVNNS